MTMFTNLLRGLLLVGIGLLRGGLLHAEGGCPTGMQPYQPNPSQWSCMPIPGYEDQQAPQQSAQQWENRWGAIATSTQDGILGVATDKRSKQEASQMAMQDCQAKGGLNCKIKLPYENGCAAVVVGDGGYNTSADATVNEAVATGMKTCRDGGLPNCHAYYTACSLPVRIR